MKKKLKCTLWVIMIIGMLALTGCKEGEKTDMEQNVESNMTEPSENQFDAKIIEVHEEYLMVEVLEGQTVAGEVQVWIGSLSEDEIPELEEGDVVRITHDGKMTMSLPPQMSAVGEIVIIQ